MSGIFQQARSFATKPTNPGAGLVGVVDSTKLDRTGRHPPLGRLRFPPETRLKFVVSPTPHPHDRPYGSTGSWYRLRLWCRRGSDAREPTG